MDQLKAKNKRLVEGYEKCLKMNQLLVKYRLYLNDYLKLCKCKESAELFLIRSKTRLLEEKFGKINSYENVVKQEFCPQNSEEDIDTRSDAITEDQCSSLDATDYEIAPNVVNVTTDVFICQRVNCNERFNSKDALELHTNVCPMEQYMCSECETTFNEMTKLKLHQAKHRQSEALLNGVRQQFQCQVVGCNKVFEKMASLNSHITRVHKDILVLPELRKAYVCDWVGCDHKASSRQDLDLHIKRKHTLEKPFKCDKCEKSFGAEKILRHHQKSHSDFRHKCDFDGCEYKTPHIWELKAHIKKKHLNDERFVCEYEGCDRHYKYEGDLKVHIKNFHLKSHVFHCEWPGCQSQFVKSESFTNHVLRHKDERKYKCVFDGCGKTFNTPPGLRNHRALHQGKVTRFPCEWPGCTKRYPTRSQVKVHLDSFHLRIRQFPCDYCDKTFTLKMSLRSHQKTYCSGLNQKDKKEYKCDECLRVFLMPKNLKNHKIAHHSSQLLYACEWPECEERFKTSHALTAHRTTHTNGGEYKCCAINCGKSFGSRETLLAHELIHDKKFVCSWPGCGKRFPKNFLLRDHIRRHQNIREFKCTVEGCGQSFITNAHLNNHLDKHSNPTPFKCTEEGCDRAFAHKKSLLNHSDKVHHVHLH